MTPAQRKALDAAIEAALAEADDVDPTHAQRAARGETALTRKQARRPKEQES